MALVLSQSYLNVSPLFLGEPLRVLRKIRNDEEEGKSNDACKQTLQDEDPAPSPVALHALHLPNGRSQETSKGASKGSTTEKERISFLGLRSPVPHADEIE